MSSSHVLNKIVQRCSNPNNSYTALNGIQYLDEMKASAQKIQCYIRNRDVKRSAKNMKAAITNQAYRLSLIKYLSKFISDNNCVQLLLGADDPEILASYSSYDKLHVATKARHITDALLTLSEAHQNSECITWIECCEKAVNKNYNQISRARTVADWYLELHEYQLLKFRRSACGRSSYFTKSPFIEDECLTVQFKSWARQDLEHLSTKKAQDFINEKLLSKWSAEQLQTNKISFPVSEYIVSRWMKETGFKYEKYKKCYYVDRHEDDDVVSDRKTYCDHFFSNEIYEHCWVQISKEQYLTLKYKRELKYVPIKTEGTNDISPPLKLTNILMNTARTFIKILKTKK